MYLFQSHAEGRLELKPLPVGSQNPCLFQTRGQTLSPKVAVVVRIPQAHAWKCSLLGKVVLFCKCQYHSQSTQGCYIEEGIQEESQGHGRCLRSLM